MHIEICACACRLRTQLHVLPEPLASRPDPIIFNSPHRAPSLTNSAVSALQGGANLSAAGGDGFTALHWVAMAGKSPRPSVPILRALRLLVVSRNTPAPFSRAHGDTHGQAEAMIINLLKWESHCTRVLEAWD